jgi:Fis family transcriptional regulator
MNDDRTIGLRLAELVKVTTERRMSEGGLDTVPGVYNAVIEEVERPLLKTVLARVNGNQTHAARVLGINRNTLRKKMRALGLN